LITCGCDCDGLRTRKKRFNTLEEVFFIMERKSASFELAQLALDEDSCKILAYTYHNPRCVKDICGDLKIPQVKAYRRIRELEELGLIKSVDTAARKRLYTSNIERIQMTLNEAHISMTAEYKDGAKSSFDLKFDTDAGNAVECATR
jgi:DNA-binding MarR family transcriptional regulator